jgi:hypothetical protein
VGKVEGAEGEDEGEVYMIELLHMHVCKKNNDIH